MTHPQFDTWLPHALSRYAVPDPIREVLLALSRCSKVISTSFDQSAVSAGSQNSSGEQQLAVDLLADRLIIDALRATGLVDCVASEEQEGVVHLDPDVPCCSVAFDPLDGSSILDAKFSVGTIFGIYTPGGFIGKSGRDLLASGYFLYGTQTVLVLALPEGVVSFRLNALGEYEIDEENIHIQSDSRFFAPGNLRACAERTEYQQLILSYTEQGFTLRYSGGLVPDLHHIITKRGGIFLYPSCLLHPDGKLRLLFELAPLAYLIEKAGGSARTETRERILDLEITALHQRSTVVLGSQSLVDHALTVLNLVR